ncbi:Cadherin-related family member 4 [Gossypium australe]|uniref:Cadherin-related family member 4 n=1 Tax=Gossypium australe TaxID=47621 RepID=A0A5B6UW71_9ROSI|nr:Cadherin-related family member 4 [Gossypium australe]
MVQTEARKPVLMYLARHRENRYDPDPESTKYIDRFPLEIRGEVFLANVIELLFGEFNLILRMDWLMEHRVSLDYASKRVTLRFDEGGKIIMIGERRDYLSNIISALVAEKLVQKGYNSRVYCSLSRETKGAYVAKSSSLGTS